MTFQVMVKFLGQVAFYFFGEMFGTKPVENAENPPGRYWSHICLYFVKQIYRIFFLVEIIKFCDFVPGT
jgi:hypothetical protein